MRHSQLTDDLQEQASLYAAGAMPESERAEYVRHLEDDQCAVCRAEVDELQAAMGMLAFSVPPAAPSATVRIRLMEQARNAAASRPAVQSSFFRLRWLELFAGAAVAASLIFVMVTALDNRELRRRADELSGRISQLEVQLAQRDTFLAKVTLPGARVVDMAGQGQNVSASGRIFWVTPEKKWLVSVRDLPPPPPNQVYELWFIPKGGKPLKAHVFTTASNGFYLSEVDLPEGALDLQAAAVTRENGPDGSEQPSLPLLLLGAAD